MPPLTTPNRSRPLEAGLLPTKAVSLTELDTMLELFSPKHKLVLIMGSLNAHTTMLAHTAEGQVTIVSMDLVLNVCSHALLFPLTQ